MLKTFEAVVIEQPKISAKQLCEYAEATANGRLAILRACKIKKPAIIAISRRYNEAENLICNFLEYSRDFYSYLIDCANDLKKSASKRIGKEKEYAESCADALLAFYNLRILLQDRFQDETIVLNSKLSEKTHKFKLKNVIVSIRPEIMISTDLGSSHSGFIKLYFGKTNPLTKTMAENMAMIGRYYFKNMHGAEFQRQNCIVIDVFAGIIYQAPEAERRAFKNLEACCEEIADRWEKVES